MQRGDEVDSVHGTPAPRSGDSLQVLLVVEQLNRRVPGGIGVSIRGLLKGLDQLDLERPEQLEKDVDRRTDHQITLYASRSPRTGDPLLHFGHRVLHSALPGPLLTRGWDLGLLRAPSGFDVVHSTSFAAPLSRESRSVVTVHDLTWRQVPEAFKGRDVRWHERSLRRILRSEALLVASCDTVAQQLADAGASSERLRVIRFGADHLPPPDLVAADDLLRRLGVKDGFILSVGTLEPRKNLGRLFEAYSRGRGGPLATWPLVVVGPKGWGPEVAPVEGVVFAGTVPDAVLAALYAKARLMVYVPLAEGFGLPPLEAMRAGTAVLASAVPSATGAAFDVDPLDVTGIADALVALVTDDAEHDLIAARGREHAAQFTWARTARAHVELWESLR